jgi:hypothetical protein
LAGQASLQGTNNPKPTIAEILAERAMIDSRTGTETTDITGEATGKKFSAVTDFDADEIRENVAVLKERSGRLQDELSGLQDLIEEKVVNADPKKVEASVDIRKDINLRNAVRRIFGEKRNTLTFEDYKRVLQLRTRFEREEVEAAAGDEVKL